MSIRKIRYPLSMLHIKLLNSTERNPWPSSFQGLGKFYKNKLNIPPEKKRHCRYVLRDTWGLFGKEGQLCECEERGASLTLTLSVYICQVPNLINYQLEILGYQHLVERSWSFFSKIFLYGKSSSPQESSPKLCGRLEKATDDPKINRRGGRQPTNRRSNRRSTDPPTDGGGLRDLYHNWTNSILEQLKTNFGKWQMHCFEFHQWLIHLNPKHVALYCPYSLVPDPHNFSNFLKLWGLRRP
jgi:hypothetical protein